MRCLWQLLGSGDLARPVHTDVWIESSGGEDEESVVVAEGSLPGYPDLEVRTTCRLSPGSRALEIETKVENTGQDMLSLFEFRDILCHGRTLRYCPGVGMFPGGRKGTARWMAFFWEGEAWGILAAGLNPFEVSYSAGDCELHYGTVDIPPGELRAYPRRLLAGMRGPEDVWRAAYPAEDGKLSRLEVSLSEEETGRPARAAILEFAPEIGGSCFAVLTGADGRAVLELPTGCYRVTARTPGRMPFGPARVSLAAGHTHVLSFPLSSRAEAAVSASLGGDDSRPLRARARAYETGRPTAEVWPGPAFPFADWRPFALVDGLAEAVLPLAPRGRTVPCVYLVAVSRGPLHTCATGRVPAVEGRTLGLPAALERVVDPGQYVAVDFRQHTASSPDCALSVGERVLLNDCEGLDGAVVSDPVWPDRPLAGPPGGECALVGAYRLEWPGIGSFTILPRGSDRGDLRELLAAVCAEPSGLDILETTRQLLPDAIVQVNTPLDSRTGFFAAEERAEDADFDLLEILSGGDVAAARRLLPRWFSMLNSGRRAAVTGGSGSRGFLGEQAGLARTFLRCPGDVLSAERLTEAIFSLPEEPDAFVTNGPLLDVHLNGRNIGSVQTVGEERARLELRVSAAPWVDVSWGRIYCNGEVVKEFPILPSDRPLRADRTIEVQVPADCWFVVEVQGDSPMAPVYGAEDAPRPWAVTNPFWVDADGDGLVRPGQ
jgi:hypothetical protein